MSSRLIYNNANLSNQRLQKLHFHPFCYVSNILGHRKAVNQNSKIANQVFIKFHYSYLQTEILSHTHTGVSIYQKVQIMPDGF